jgi:hypothetical protein
MSLVQEQPTLAPAAAPLQATEIRVYSHSPLFYWWPVWTLGFVLALLTYWQGESTAFGDATVVMHASKSLGVIYTVVFFLVILMTHVTVRGLASLTVIVALLGTTFLFAYLGWWDDIFRAFDKLAIYMNLGFYVFFSTAVLLVWVLAFFVFDRFNYWLFRPGQVVHQQLFGAGAQAFDTQGMSVFKLRDDLFRHWILGVGSGDLHIATTGAKREEFIVPNVLFIGVKLARIQQLVAMKPDLSPGVIAAGEPG